MEKIKAKVEQVLHKNDHTDTTTTGAHSSTHTTGTHTNTTGAHGGIGHSDPTGPHDSRLGNKADPRVNSDHVGAYGNTTGYTTGGLTGNTHTGTHTGTHGGGLTGNTYGSDPTGPHDSHLGNRVDPRVDSDHVGGYGNTTGHTTGGGLTGNTHTGTHSHGSDPTGPHDSRLANKLDPRVDSDQVGSYGNTTHGTHTGTHSGTHGGGLTGNTYGSDPTGPHDSRLGNKADPRVDSDHVGGYGNTTHGTHTGTHTGTHGVTGNPGTHTGYTGEELRGNPTHIGQTGHQGGLTGSTAHGHNTHGTTGHGLTGSHLPGPAPGTAGPHKSDLLNKADPRVDADLDGSKTYGGNKTYGN